MATIYLHHPKEFKADVMEDGNGDRPVWRLSLDGGKDGATVFLTEDEAHDLAVAVAGWFPPDDVPQAEAEAAAREVDGEPPYTIIAARLHYCPICGDETFHIPCCPSYACTQKHKAVFGGAK